VWRTRRIRLMRTKLVSGVELDTSGSIPVLGSAAECGIEMVMTFHSCWLSPLHKLSQSSMVAILMT